MNDPITVVPINHLLWCEIRLSDALLAVGLCDSRSDVRRMFEQNGIRVNDERSPERLLFLNDLRQPARRNPMIMLRRGQSRFHWLEFSDYETAGAYAPTPSWFHKSGEIGWSTGWATRDWGLDAGAIDSRWVHR